LIKNRENSFGFYSPEKENYNENLNRKLNRNKNNFDINNFNKENEDLFSNNKNPYSDIKQINTLLKDKYKSSTSENYNNNQKKQNEATIPKVSLFNYILDLLFSF